MSNKEFRMMKFEDFDFLLRHSTFVVRPARYALKLISSRFAMAMSFTATVALQSASQGRRVFYGSLLNFLRNILEIAS
jgi:hypothetical protein